MGLIGVDTEDDLAKIEADAARLHAEGVLDASGLSQRLAVVAGIRRIRDNGREDLAWQLLHAWLDGHDATAR